MNSVGMIVKSEPARQSARRQRVQAAEMKARSPARDLLALRAERFGKRPKKRIAGSSKLAFVWESAPNRVGEDLRVLLERLITSGAYRPGAVPYCRPLFIDQHGVAHFHQYLPIDQLLSLEPPTEDAVACAVEEVSQGHGRLPVAVLLEAERAGTVVENAEYFEATRRQGFDVVRCWVRLGWYAVSARRTHPEIHSAEGVTRDAE